jgi:hypothetical protein
LFVLFTILFDVFFFSIIVDANFVFYYDDKLLCKWLYTCCILS